MITPYDVYIVFKNVESEIKKKGYRLNTWENLSKNKLNKSSRDNLQLAADYFNTVWQDIDIEDYMRTGFSLFKTFNFKSLLNPKIIKRYIHNDKTKKRKISIDDKMFVKSFKFVKNKIDKTTISDILKEYGRDKEQAIQDYLYNKIDGGFLFYLICLGYINIEHADIDRLCYIKWNFNELKHELEFKRGKIDALLYGMY